jgi:hypothetical protein
MVGAVLTSLLAALYRAPKGAGLPVGWHWRPPRNHLTWRDWLREGLVDDDQRNVPGWRTTPEDKA